MKSNKKFLFLIFTIFVIATGTIGCIFNSNGIDFLPRQGEVISSGEADILQSKLSAYESQEHLENEEIQRLTEEIERIRDQNIPVDGNIAVVRLFGVLNQNNVLPITVQLRKLADDKDIGGVILWIDSPGGGVTTVTQIYDEIYRLRTRKPVVAYVGGIAASGGYYLTVACDKIVAKPDAVLGGIGVIYVHEDLTEYFKKHGIKIEVIKTGEEKDLGAPWRPLTDEDRENIRNNINESFNRFIYVVSRGRDLTIEEVLEYSDGNTWRGQQAVTYGFADRVGDLDTAIEELKTTVGLKSPEILFIQIDESGRVSNMNFESMRYQYEPSLYIQKR